MDSDFKTAFAGVSVNRALLLSAQVRRTIYPFAASENPATWVANVNGTVPLAIANESGGLFFLDPVDGSTPADGITVIRSQDNYCYKISNMRMPDSVLAIGVDEPTGSEEIGDSYVTSDAPDGEFAYNPSQIAVLTIRGWLFIEPVLGRPLYSRAAGKHYFRDENGLWLPTFAPLSGSIKDADLVGGNLYRAVENSTTNTPPVSPGAGVYWRVGGSPTGAWAGQADKIATKYAGDADWTFITPVPGMAIYDKLAKITYVYNGTTWESQRGAIIDSNTSGRLTSISTTTGGSGNWTLSATVAPTTATGFLQDNTTARTITAVTDRRILFNYRVWFATAKNVPFALRRGTENTYVSWTGFVANPNNNGEINVRLEVAAVDGSPHLYSVVQLVAAGVTTEVPSMAELSYEVYA